MSRPNTRNKNKRPRADESASPSAAVLKFVKNVLEKESCALVEKLNYLNKDIHVYLVCGKEAPKSIREASAAFPVPDRRTSKRSQRTTYGNSISLKVSGSTSVYQLKLMIWESLGIVKENHKLHKGSVEIEDDFATLADKSNFRGDVLWVRDSEMFENRDIADEISEQKADVVPAEEGFRGTLLTSSVSAQICQDIALSEWVLMLTILLHTCVGVAAGYACLEDYIKESECIAERRTKLRRFY